MTDQGMTRTERNDLISLLRRRAKVAKHDVEARAARLKADVEAQLQTEFDQDDKRWKDAHARAQADIDALNERIHEQMTAEGLPEALMPGAVLEWVSRSRFSYFEVRNEIRRLAVARIAETTAESIAAIERAAVRTETDLIAATSRGEAQAFLLSLPTVEQLLPAGFAAQLAGELLAGGGEDLEEES